MWRFIAARRLQDVWCTRVKTGLCSVGFWLVVCVQVTWQLLVYVLCAPFPGGAVGFPTSPPPSLGRAFEKHL